jgi:hypothetical protein
MASIRSLDWNLQAGSGWSAQSANGLVLGNKEGFYRDLGTDIFTNNDYVRVAIWYSVNLNSNPNATAGISPELVTNFNPSDYFYCGLKTPNANFPDEAQIQSKFCGYFMPPRTLSNAGPGIWTLSFDGFRTGPPAYWGNPTGGQDALFLGDLSTPYAQNEYTTTRLVNLSTNRIDHGIGGTAGTGNPAGIGVLGFEIRNDNTVLGNYTGTAVDVPYSAVGNPALSAMRSYINNQSFLSNTISLSNNAPYGEATAMFMYNPLNTNCIRVHGMIAAGFTR